MDNLHLETKNIDVSLAERYVAKCEILKDWPEPDTYLIIKNKTNVSKYEINTRHFSNVSRSEDNIEDYLKLRQLAKKIEENCELFCQLEYLLRKTNPEDVRRGHIKLICQYIRLQEPSYNEDGKYFVFDEDTPLYYLGYFGNLQLTPHQDIITTSQNLSPICYLFHELCCDVGLDIPLIVINEQTEISRHPNKNLDCWWVITERADLESAADALANSSITAPWRVTHVWVQESVLDEWTRAAEARRGAGAGGVPVSAYRTAREAAAETRAAPLLSVWSADGSEAGELAHRAAAPYVWVNAHGAFDGPPRAALPLYARAWGGRRARPAAAVLPAHAAWGRRASPEREDAALRALAGGGAPQLVAAAARAARAEAGGAALTAAGVVYVVEAAGEALCAAPLSRALAGAVAGGAALAACADAAEAAAAAALHAAGVPLMDGAQVDIDTVKRTNHLSNVKVVHSTYEGGSKSSRNGGDSGGWGTCRR